MLNRRILNKFIGLSLLISAVAGCQPVETPRHPPGFSSFLAQDGKKLVPPANLNFPADHLAHPEYGIEWWYLTANLKAQDQTDLWLQWTLFRVRNGADTSISAGVQQQTNSWSDGQFYMAHFSLHTPEQHVSREMFARGGVGNAAVEKKHIFINNWRLNKSDAGLPEGLQIGFGDDKPEEMVSLNLTLDTSSRMFLHGDNGYSVKHPTTELASNYYSLPDIDVSGDINIGGVRYQVTGNAWYDHEWSSAFLSNDFSGWTWFSFHLENGDKLTLFTLQPSADSPHTVSWYGAFMDFSGNTTFLTDGDISVEDVSFIDTSLGRLPQSWRIGIQKLTLDLEVTVKKPEQISPFSIPYYEGAVSVSGSSHGEGFVEMTR